MKKPTKILRLPEVIKRTGRSRSSIYADAKIGKFPKAINLSERSVGWIEADIDEWLEKRIAESRLHV